MRTSTIPRLVVRTLEPRIKRSPTKSKRATRARPCYIEFPQKLWDRIILLLFTCCLFVFLHAFLGFGSVDEDLRALNDTFVHPHTPLSNSPPRTRGSAAPNEDQKIHVWGVSRVMVDWHGNYELLPSTTAAVVSPASIPQDAFPDPTPTLVRVERGQVLDQGSLSMTTKVDTPADILYRFYATPYDPFRLLFEDSVEGGENHGLFPVAGPPRTPPQGARTRRFGRCLPDEVCL